MKFNPISKIVAKGALSNKQIPNKLSETALRLFREKGKEKVFTQISEQLWNMPFEKSGSIELHKFNDLYLRVNKKNIN